MSNNDNDEEWMETSINVNSYKYVVSNKGNVAVQNPDGSIRQIKVFQNSKGYPNLNITANSITHNFLVNRLVAQAFIPNPDNKPFVDHINHNIKDNRVENLRWATKNENQWNRKNRQTKY